MGHAEVGFYCEGFVDMFRVIILSPVPNIFGKCVAVQTDPIEDEGEQETGQVIEEEDEGIDVDGSVAI